MKIFFIFLITISPLLSQWKEQERPISLYRLNNIASGSDFLVGSLDDPYFSFDNGETWEKRTNGLPEKRGIIEKIIVDNDFIYIKSMSTIINPIEFFYYTKDKGLNWLKVGEYQDYSNSKILRDIKVKNNIIYVLPFSYRSVIKSIDFGETWDTLGLWDKNINYMNYLDVRNDTIVVADAGAFGSAGPVNSGVIVSIDGGKTWEKRNNGLGLGNITCLKIYKNNIFVGNKDGFYFSENFGESYKRAGSIIYNTYLNDIEIIDDTVYIATETGLYKAIDLWKEWVEIPQFKLQRVFEIHYGLNKLFVSASHRNYSNSKSYYSKNLELFDVLRFKKESDLNTFEFNFPNLYFSTENFTGNSIYKIDGFNSENIEITTDYYGESLWNISTYEEIIACKLRPYTNKEPKNRILLSNDLGNTWEIKEILNEQLDIREIFVLNQDSLLLGTKNGLYFSSDLGTNWDLFLTKDSIVNENLSKILNIKKINNKIYLYGDGRILETDKNLTYWKQILTEKSNDFYNEIFDVSKFKNNVFIVSFKGQFIEPSTIDFTRSTDEGKTWENIENRFNDYNDIRFLNVYNIEDYVFVGTTSGVFYSKDNGDSFEEINDGLSNSAMSNGKEFYIYDDKLVYCSGGGIFHRNLEELGITLLVEKTEERNYLYTFPPFPQPTKQEVKISTYWDSALPFTIDDVEIYNLAGIKVNTTNKLSIKKETNYKGHIIWDTSGEQAGIYIVNIKHGTETRTQKVMVEK